MKSLQKEQNNKVIDGINVQSPQSESTPRRLTLNPTLQTVIVKDIFLFFQKFANDAETPPFTSHICPEPNE